MIEKKHIRLGICPIGKFIFSHEDAMAHKQRVLAEMDRLHVDYCTVDEAVPDGMIRDQSHVEPAVKHLKSQGVDALFIPHCNFGTEGAAAMIAKQCGVPVLLWGPRDPAPLPDGSRLRDTLCGMFATSKVLKKLKVPFTYIENCHVEEEAFLRGFSVFMRASRVVKTVKTMRIGFIGSRIDFFWTTIINESELLERFGIQIQPIDLVECINGVKKRAELQEREYREEISQITTWLDLSHVEQQDFLVTSLAFRDELLHLKQEHKVDALAVQSFNSIPRELGPGLGLGLSLAQNSMVLAGESDIHGAVSSLMIQAASSTDEPCFFPDIVSRHPENENAVLLWHGSGPTALKHPECSIIEMHPPWTLRYLPPSKLSFRLKDGPLTICRFDGDTGSYQLGAGEGHTVDGPYTREFYTWMEVDDWKAWERDIIEGPFIHHCSAVFDHCADVLIEAVKYIPGLEALTYGSSGVRR